VEEYYTALFNPLNRIIGILVDDKWCVELVIRRGKRPPMVLGKAVKYSLNIWEPY